MQTLDPIQTLPAGALSSPAARRNVEPILAVLKAHMPPRGRVLEIAAGSGEHAVAFAAAFPEADWLPSDPSVEARSSIEAWRVQSGLPNLHPAHALDASDTATWPQGMFDAIFCANMVHISPWQASIGLMTLAGARLVRPGGLLALYGPYRENDQPLADSNAAFDVSLKSRNPEWGLRQREDIEALAKEHKLLLVRRIEMPANNLMLLFRAI